MTFPTVTAERRALRQSVADLLAKHSGEERVRALMAAPHGFDLPAWRALAAAGIVGLVIPDRFGGADAGAAELEAVLAEMGRALLVSPYLATAVLVPALLTALDDEAECAAVLPRIAAGELIATFAFAEGSCARPPDRPATAAVPAGDGWRVTGEKRFVLDAGSAELLYVLADTAGGPAIFAVDANAAGLEITPLETVDMTRKMAAVRLRETPGRLVGAPGGAAVAAALDLAGLALVAEQAGGARRVVEMARDYAKTRFQFGRAIGSFQAVKHLCADMLLEAESATSAARFVAGAFDAGAPDCRSDLALAQAYCSDAYVFVAATNIQVHGGIGFTWEHPAHLYLRRARGDAQLFGDPAWHRERYLQAIGA